MYLCTHVCTFVRKKKTKYQAKQWEGGLMAKHWRGPAHHCGGGGSSSIGGAPAPPKRYTPLALSQEFRLRGQVGSLTDLVYIICYGGGGGMRRSEISKLIMFMQ